MTDGSDELHPAAASADGPAPIPPADQPARTLIPQGDAPVPPPVFTPGAPVVTPGHLVESAAFLDPSPAESVDAPEPDDAPRPDDAPEPEDTIASSGTTDAPDVTAPAETAPAETPTPEASEPSQASGPSQASEVSQASEAPAETREPDEPAADAQPPTAAAATAVLTPVAAPAAAAVSPGATPVSHRAAKRRRWPWVVLAVVLATLVLATAGVLWYLSTLIGNAVAIDQPGEPFPLTVLSADGGTISYTEGTSSESEAALMGIATIQGGYVQTSDPVTVGSGTVATTTRAIDKQVLAPPPATNQRAALDAWFFPHDPKVGLGVDFESVVIDMPAGPAPAWYIPGTKDTWVIFTHGRAATPREGLRIASTVTRLGYPMLLITYRDDAGAPAEDGLGNFGQTEVPDLEAAVQYALDKGAARIVLAGASMGGAIDLAFLQHSPLATSVVGAFLDSPASDLGRMVRAGAADMGVPDVVTSAAMQVAAWRFGIDWSAVDHTAGAGAITVPLVVVQGEQDAKVPPSVNEALASAAGSGIVQYEVFPGAGHVQAWNVDRTRYDSLLGDFLVKVAP